MQIKKLTDKFIIMIPDISKQEWQEVIKGNTNSKLSSFSLQMKINSLNRQYHSGLISIKNAVKELHEMCTKYEKIYEDDLSKIF